MSKACRVNCWNYNLQVLFSSCRDGGEGRRRVKGQGERMVWAGGAKRGVWSMWRVEHLLICRSIMGVWCVGGPGRTQFGNLAYTFLVHFVYSVEEILAR